MQRHSHCVGLSNANAVRCSINCDNACYSDSRAWFTNGATGVILLHIVNQYTVYDMLMAVVLSANSLWVLSE